MVIVPRVTSLSLTSMFSYFFDGVGLSVLFYYKKYFLYLSVHPSIHLSCSLKQKKKKNSFANEKPARTCYYAALLRPIINLTDFLHRNNKKRFAYLSLFCFDMTRRSFPWKLKRLSWLCDRTTVEVLLLFIILIYCKVFHYVLWGRNKFHKSTVDAESSKEGWKETLWCR